MIEVDLSAVYVISEEIVARTIEGELLIVPLSSGVGDMEDELYTLNETGRAVWARLDGQRTLHEIAGELATQYEAPADLVERDVAGLAGELARRKIIIRRG